MGSEPDLPVAYERFVTIVEQVARVRREDAERAIRTTLRTLAERIDPGEARDLAEELPQELAPWVATAGPAERFDVDEFVRRIAERDGVDQPTAERRAEAVFVALGRTLSDKEFADLVAELPKDFSPLLPRGPDIEVVPTGWFLQRVADRAGTDLQEARRATDAVLETLAMRIAGGEVDDLRMRLPLALHPALKRGGELSGATATRMRLDSFVRRVAELEGISPDAALDHVRAVLGTLREAVGEQEFRDVTAQLSDEYKVALAPVGRAGLRGVAGG
jgi:uncharacterized protein (DUF2267 family)